ncbi:MAG TPA: DUF1987 domain-containing protein [Bacteroidia bacterium]|jgi:hypothetical protein|nr:DUF1987 domain-containing protein [Bacteroidia bacterium]
MDTLKIEKTEDSPAVLFDPTTSQLSLTGESRPENAGKFYNPLLDWISKFEALLFWRKEQKMEQKPVCFSFCLDYFNSTSAKYIMDIILTLQKLADKGYPVKVEWHCDKRDEDMLDAGKEFAEMVKLKFEFIPS